MSDLSDNCTNWGGPYQGCLLFIGAGCSHGKDCVGYVPRMYTPSAGEPVELVEKDESYKGPLPVVKAGSYHGKPTIMVGVKGEF